jgi:hypothetical protein
MLSSVCTMAHLCHPERPNPNTHPAVVAVRTAIRRNHPKRAPRPARFYSLYRVFEVLHHMQTATIDTLRMKLITLLMIDGMTRSANLAVSDRDSIRFSPTYSLVTYDYVWPKNKVDNGRVNTTVHAYPEDPLICTVTVLREYLERVPATPEMYNDPVRGRFRPLLMCLDNSDKKGKPLGAQRISKYPLEVLRGALPADSFAWKASSIRGAASSKCLNLGAEPSRVQLRGTWDNLSTLLKTYFRPGTYDASPPDARSLSLESLLRFRGVRALQ